VFDRSDGDADGQLRHIGGDAPASHRRSDPAHRYSACRGLRRRATADRGWTIAVRSNGQSGRVAQGRRRHCSKRDAKPSGSQGWLRRIRQRPAGKARLSSRKCGMGGSARGQIRSFDAAEIGRQFRRSEQRPAGHARRVRRLPNSRAATVWARVRFRDCDDEAPHRLDIRRIASGWRRVRCA
jgi:hypothetical protein